MNNINYDSNSNKIIIYAALAALIIGKDLDVYELNLARKLFSSCWPKFRRFSIIYK